MPRKKISQREARQYKKRVTELERAVERYTTSSCPGTYIDTLNISSTERGVVRTAQRLGYGIVAVPVSDKDQVRLFAVKS